MLTSHRFSSTLGTVTLYLEDEVLIGLDLAGTAGCGGRLMAQLARHGVDTAAFRPEATPAAQAVEAWLTRYAAGSREQFALPRKLYGTPFQIAVWEALEALGYDEVISYAELAGGWAPTDSGQWAPPWGTTPFPSSFPATASCARTA